jgi:hypothetical protein
MPASTPSPADDPAKAPPMTDEADIGSGEKTPGELETEQQIKAIPPLPKSGGADQKAEPGQ